MEKNVPKGHKKVAQACSLCLLFLQMVALNRLRHGVKGIWAPWCTSHERWRGEC